MCPLHPPPLGHTGRLAAESCWGGTGTGRSPVGCGTQRHRAEETAGTHLCLVEERGRELQLDRETEAGGGQGSEHGLVPYAQGHAFPETPARTPAWPASAQRAVARRAGTAICPCGVLAKLVVAAGVGPLSTFIDIWRTKKGQSWGGWHHSGGAPCYLHAPPWKGPYQCSTAAGGSG